jgi:enoyl-CoA hydratase/carnithine racemase
VSDQSFADLPELETVDLRREGRVLVVGLDRPEKRNSFNRQLLRDLALAYALVEDDPDVWCGLVHGKGDHLTTGLDLADVAGDMAAGSGLVPEEGRDPWRLDGRWSTPVVAVAHGWCMTAGIELLLAADVRVAAEGTRFTQLEVRRGIYPVGGATMRFPRDCGWGNAMRWMLTGDEFDAAEALRIGLVQEVLPDAAAAFDRGLALARSIAGDAAPLAVRATLESAQRAIEEGDAAAVADFAPGLQRLFGTDDVAEGVASFVERRAARFTGR